MKLTFPRISRLDFAYTAITILLLCSSIAVGVYTVRLEIIAFREEQRSDAADLAIQTGVRLVEKIYDLEAVGQRVANYVRENPELDATDLQSLAEVFLAQHPGVRSIVFAPDLVVSHVSPLSGNENIVGTSYRDLPEKMPAIERSIMTRRAIFDGPTTLNKGGSGYIIRYPIFSSTVNQEDEKFWGIVSVSIPSSDLLTSQLYPIFNVSPEDYAIREIDDQGQEINFLAGSQDVLLRDPVHEIIPALGSHWEISIAPRLGWQLMPPTAFKLIAALIFSVVLLIAMVVTIRLLNRKNTDTLKLITESIKASGEGIVVFDAQDRVMITNPKFTQLLRSDNNPLKIGTTFEQMLREGISHDHLVGYSASDEAWISSRLEAHRSGFYEGTYLNRDDRWLKVIETQTVSGNTVCIVSDITDYKLAQIAAEAANENKTQFIGKISHELRTPLTIISGYMAFLLSAAQKASNQIDAGAMPGLANDISQVLSQGGRIKSAAEHMKRIVEDLLDLASTERGLFKLNFEKVDIAALARDVSEDFRSEFESKGLKLVTEIPDTVSLVADYGRLKQVLYNLLSNALRFTDKGRIEVLIDTSTEGALISITDTGIGIAESEHERIFETFHQVDNSDARRHGGFGLGLSIATEIVRNHGGQIALDSELGAGTSMTVFLPFNPEQPITSLLAA